MQNFQGIGQRLIRVSGKLLILALFSVAFWTPAWAATDAVVGNGTPASCTRNALATAVAAGGTVTFNCGADPHTIDFGDGADISIGVDVVIDGDNRITLTSSANRIFLVQNGFTLTLRQLAISDVPATSTALYVSGALIVDDSSFTNNLRGAIYNDGGTITISDSLFEGNVAPSTGGAIVNEGDGVLHITGSTFRNNSIMGSNWGGALFNSSGATATIRNSLFEGNEAINGTGGAINNSNVMTIEHTIVRDNVANGGGGIYSNGELTVINSHISGNRSTTTYGGGIAHHNLTTSPSFLRVIQSTIDDNVAEQTGGGISFNGPEGTLEVINSTIHSNTANTQGGGGLLVAAGNATLTNVTFDANTALATAGDSIQNRVSPPATPATVTIENTLVIGGDCDGPIVDGDGNLEFPGTSCGFDTPSADPGLGELAANGGWTPTQAITETGPAQNTAVNAKCPATDQRGVLRPQFTNCDIGAFEWGALPILNTITPTYTWALSPTFTLVVNGANFIPGSPRTEVLWNGQPLPTTYVNGNQVNATVDDSLIVTGQQVTITVRTPVIDGGVSENSEIFTVFKRPQTINFDELADRGVEPATFNLDVSASSGLSVTLTAEGVCTVAGNTVTLSGEFGACTITANQPGNESYEAAPQVVRTFNVKKLDQTIDFPELTDRGPEPATFTISATASSGLTVTFTAAGVCTVAGNTVTLTGDEGACTITAQQAGDANYNAAPDVVREFEVTTGSFMRLPQIFGKPE